MCGFAGILSGVPDETARSRAAVRIMSEHLAHRGPDDHGEWVDPSGHAALAFRRLAILDLSPAGHQPMTSHSGRYTVAFNGEVYNFRRIRAELGEQVPFRGESDTEVILHAFERWGVRRALDRFIGMFAIAVWDRDTRSLILIRDRMGIKPLYVARTRTGVAFASELNALRTAPGLDTALDLDGLRAFVQYLYFPAPHTPIASIRKLEPGHLMEIRPHDLQDRSSPIPQSEPWWTLEGIRRSQSDRARSERGDAEAIQELELLLQDAIKLRMIADVPLGALLSGGIDSSLVVALMQQQSGHPVRTFSIGFDDPIHDEAVHARKVAEHLGTEHAELRVTGSDALDLVPRMPHLFDEPLADPSVLPTYLVSELARRHVTVALTGDGGDELFAGYTRHTAGLGIIHRLSRFPALPRRWLGSALQRVSPELLGRWLPRVPGRLGRMRLPAGKTHKLGRLLSEGPSWEIYRSLIRTVTNPDALLVPAGGGADLVAERLRQLGESGLSLGDLLQVDQEHYLPDDLLQKVDRSSMAVSLEARVPLLDHRVVEFSWGLPDAMKLRNGRGKWIPREILDRHVPRELIDRPKTGFTVPVESWLEGPLREWAEEILLAPDPFRDALFRSVALRTSWERFLAGRREEALGLWAVLTFLAWCRSWGIESISEPGVP
jgi:asparagine synthase (glutamine-hydrolysing)